VARVDKRLLVTGLLLVRGLSWTTGVNLQKGVCCIKFDVASKQG